MDDGKDRDVSVVVIPEVPPYLGTVSTHSLNCNFPATFLSGLAGALLALSFMGLLLKYLKYLFILLLMSILIFMSFLYRYYND